MADEKKGGGGGGSPPEMWHIVLLVLAALAVAGYVWYKHNENPNWNPYGSMGTFQSGSPEPILP